MEEKKSGLAVASLVLGIIGTALSPIPIVNNGAFVLGALALIFGAVGIAKSSKKGMAIAGLILGIAAVVLTVTIQNQTAKALDKASDEIQKSLDEFDSSMDDITGDNTEKILNENLDVELGEFIVEKGDFISDTSLEVKITNKGKETKSFSIKIEAVAEDGSRITTDTVYADSLTASQSQTLKAFTFVTSDQIEKLEKAEFKVLEVSMY